MEKVHIESVKLDQEFNNARCKMNAELRNSLRDNEIEHLAAIHFHTIMEEDEDLRMEGANEADLYASVAKQVEATDGQANFSSPETWSEFGLSQRQYDRIGEALELIEPDLRQALARGDTSIVRNDVDERLNSNGIKLASNCPVYRKLPFSVLKSLEKQKKRQKGEGRWKPRPHRRPVIDRGFQCRR